MCYMCVKSFENDLLGMVSRYQLNAFEVDYACEVQLVEVVWWKANNIFLHSLQLNNSTLHFFGIMVV